MVYKYAKAKKTWNTWFTHYDAVSNAVGNYSSADGVRKAVMDKLSQDVKRVGWAKVSKGGLGVGPVNDYTGYLIYKDGVKVMYVYAWSRSNPNKGHGYTVYMIKNDTNYELNPNGKLGRKE